MHTSEKVFCPVCHSDKVIEKTRIIDHSISQEEFTLSQCPDCSFLCTTHVPSEADAGRYYQSEDYVSHSNTSTGLIFRLYHIVRNIMLGRKYNLLNRLGAKASLLDVGCGTGYFLDFAKTKGYSVQGIEIDDAARQYGIDHFGIQVTKPETLFNGTMGNNTFGYITLWHVLEHLYDPNKYFHQFRSLLDEKGYLIIAVPNHDCYEAKYYKTFWAAYDVPRHLWHFTPKTLEKIANANGFVLASKHLMPFDPFYNAMLSEKYKKSNLGFIKGMWFGGISLLKGMWNVDKASSIIYVLKKR
jgi:2-polyprenyl-3-methyl-5-hydroxy-6-metoxy-1,4-benzoquinol methylase